MSTASPCIVWDGTFETAITVGQRTEFDPFSAHVYEVRKTTRLVCPDHLTYRVRHLIPLVALVVKT